MITIYTYEEFYKYIQTKDDCVLIFKEISPVIKREDKKFRTPSKECVYHYKFLFSNEKFAAFCEIDKSNFRDRIDFSKYLYLKYLDIVLKKLKVRF